MGIRLQIILTACIGKINNVLTSVQPHNQGIYSQVNDDGEIRKNFRNLFDALAKKDAKKSEVYHGTLREDVAKERHVFDSMREELRVAQNINAFKKRKFYKATDIGEDIVAKKREIAGNNSKTTVSTTFHPSGPVGLNNDEEETEQKKPARGIFTQMKEEIEHLHWFFTKEDDVPPAIEAARSSPVDVPKSVSEEGKALYVSTYQTWIAILKNSRSKIMLSHLRSQFEKFAVTGDENIARAISLLYLLLSGSTLQDVGADLKIRNESEMIKIFKTHWQKVEQEHFKTLKVIYRMYRTPLCTYKGRTTNTPPVSNVHYG